MRIDNPGPANVPSGSAQPVPGSSVPLGDSGEVADIVAKARGRADGFTYGDDRAIGTRPNWEAQESRRLYEFATVNNVPGSAEEVGQLWSSHSSTLQRAADDLYNAISELGAAWIGQGAGAAQGALVGIANSSSQAAEAANTMSSRLAQQAAAAAELKKMPEPVEFDPAQETAAMLAGGPAAMVKDMKPKFDAARDVKAQQVAYLEAYTAAMSEIDSTTPSFGPESLGLKPTGGASTLRAGSVGDVGGHGAIGGGVAGAVFSGIGTTPLGVHGTEGLAASGSDSQQRGPAAPQQHPAAPAPAAGSVSATGAVSSAPASGGGGPNLAALGGAVAGGALGAAGVRSLAKGSRSGATKASESSSTTSAQPGSSAASVQPQSQGIVGSAGTIGAGQAPPPAAAPMGGMGAAGGQRDEDKEHTHASFLIEADPDETFGATQATPPPVLGAWGPDDEER